jgi:hypothetical protein
VFPEFTPAVLSGELIVNEFDLTVNALPIPHWETTIIEAVFDEPGLCAEAEVQQPPRQTRSSDCVGRYRPLVESDDPEIVVGLLKFGMKTNQPSSQVHLGDEQRYDFLGCPTATSVD